MTKNDALQNFRSFGQKMSEFPHQNMKKGTFEHFLAQKRVYPLVLCALQTGPWLVFSQSTKFNMMLNESIGGSEPVPPTKKYPYVVTQDGVPAQKVPGGGVL